MGLRGGRMILLFLFLSGFSAAETQPDQTRAFTISEYSAQLDHLLSTTKQLGKDPQSITDLLTQIPPVWRIQTPQRTFEISSEWLRRDLNDLQTKDDQRVRDRMVQRLDFLRAEAASFEAPGADISGKRALLNSILARPEFQGIHGPDWFDRAKQRVGELLIRLLGRLFQSSAIPTISNILVYGLIGLAVLALAYWMYRAILNSTQLETILPGSTLISSKEWTLWMAEAQAAASAGEWRNAIHLAYWCGISFLEARGMWRPDGARTPREYLRLLPSASEYRLTLVDLTRSFELVWYGTQEADSQAFARTMAQLEELGCRSI